MFSIILLISCITFSVQANPVKSYLECPTGSNDCAKNVGKEIYELMLKPNPEIGAEELDPMYQKEINVDLDFIKYTLRNTTVKGYRTCQLQDVSTNREEKTLHLETLCQNFALEGQYDINGKILSLDVQGNGDYTLVSGKYKLVVDLQFEIKTKDDKDYLHIKSFSFKADPLEPLTYNLTNLFGGNKQLGDDFLKVANTEWKPVAYILQDPVFRANIKKIVQNGNRYLKTFPIN